VTGQCGDDASQQGDARITPREHRHAADAMRCDEQPAPRQAGAARANPLPTMPRHSQLSMQTMPPGGVRRMTDTTAGVSRHDRNRTRCGLPPRRAISPASRASSVDLPLPCGPTSAAVPPRHRSRSASAPRSSGRPDESSGSIRPGLVNRVENGLDAGGVIGVLPAGCGPVGSDRVRRRAPIRSPCLPRRRSAPGRTTAP
jgi:hypothetical protein